MSRLRATAAALGIAIACSPAVAGRMPSFGPAFNEACARFEREVGSLDSRAYAPAQVAPEKNAAIPVAEALAALKLDDAEQTVLIDLVHLPTASWTDAQRVSIREILDRNAHALDRARDAVRRSGAQMDIDHRRPGVATHPKLSRLIALDRLLLIDGREALDVGNDRRAVEDSEALATISRVLGSEPSFPEILMGRTAENFQLLLVKSAVESTAAGPTALQELDQGIPKTDPRKAVERVIVYDLISTLDLVSSVAFRPGEEETAVRIGAIYSFLLDRARQAVVRVRHGFSPDEPGDAAPESGGNGSAAEVSDEEGLREVLLREPVDLGQWSRAQVTLAAHRLAHAAIAIRTEGMIVGKYPTSLDGVVADCDGLSYEVMKDGSAVLAARDAQKLNDEITSSGGQFRDQGLTWVLPPLAPPSGRD